MGIIRPYEQELAETEALTMLTWLAAHEEVFDAFLGSTGASVADVAGRAADPAFLASVVDFMLTEDAHIIAWAQAVGRKPETVLQIRAGLPGGDHWNWT
jgi:ABC-type uncharacterized transport system YnjBCD substrate-binding protein